MKIKMTKRLLDKKIVKISSNESADDQTFNYNWDLNFSSDEDIFLKGKSEILWSRTRDLFDSPDSCGSFSDFTGRTLSSCSWHNDEFDMKSLSKVNASLEAIDSALYEKVKSPFLNDTVFQECCDWAEKFPYLRLKGQQIHTQGHRIFAQYSTSTVSTKNLDLENSSSSLHLKGKRLPIHSAGKQKEVAVGNINDSKMYNSFEEPLDNQEHEEYFALHKSDQPSISMDVPTNDSFKVNPSIKLLQDKVLDKLVSEMWPSVLSYLENLSDKNSNITHDLQLPPITVSNDQKRTLCLKRPKTEGSSIANTEFPKLDNILTVSPKVLQKREPGCISRVVRPNSEMSVNPRMSSKSIYHHSSRAQINSDCPLAKSSRGDKESENLCLVLPALEEDFQDSTSVLRGFHIEPSRKYSANKTVQSSRDEYDMLSTSRENDYFLPPIEDKNYLASNVKLTKNLFTFYGSPTIQSKSKYSGSAKYKKTNSRPNTSVSKKNIKSNEVTQQLPVNSGLYIAARGVNKTSLCDEKSSEEAIVNSKAFEESQEKPVTLFPIVTSLTPYEEKNNVRKGLLQNFLGGRKR